MGSESSPPADRGFAVYLTRKFPEPVSRILEPHFEISSNDSDTPVERDELLRQIEGVDAILCTLNDQIDRTALGLAQNLKVVSTYSVGYDHIDVDFATKLGVYVSNTPDVLTDATADLTMALMLALSRRLVEGHNFVVNKEWNMPWFPSFMLGSDLSNKSLGLIGFGRIGKAVAKRARGFGMNIRYYSSSRAPKSVELELGVSNSPLETLLMESDFVSLHLPLTNKTSQIISYDKIKLMKRSAYLINTSRGLLVDESGLADALRREEIAGAGLDVFHSEPLSESSPLLEVENIILTPHLGSATVETRYRMGEMAASNIRNVLFGIRPLSIVNSEVMRTNPLGERK
jgi:glyoxylate reductase